jgi:membrane-bound serine protease (ClpP class)
MGESVTTSANPAMEIILLLFVLGIVLLFLDLFVPGIILSFFGTMAFLAGTARAFREFGMGGGLLAFGIGMVLLGIALYIEYGVLPKTRFGKKFFLHSAVSGTSQPAAEAATLTGREGVVVTPLVPTGQIEIDGRRHEAQSLDGRLPAGTRVKVTGAQNFSLTVTKL